MIKDLPTNTLRSRSSKLTVGGSIPTTRTITHAAVLVVFTALAIVWHAAPAQATGSQVTVLSPVGGTLTSSPLESPPHHHFWGNFSVDIAAGAGTAVYARFSNANGTVALSVVGTFEPCATPGAGGIGVRVQVTINGAVVGIVHYAHLASPHANGAIANGDQIGVLVNQTATSCWTGPHVHVELGNNGNGKACFVSRGLGAGMGASTPVGVIGGGYASADNQTCPPGAENGGGPTDADGDGIPDSADRCPSQPGPAGTQGCPDADSDSTADLDDPCPTRHGPAMNSACPPNMVTHASFEGGGWGWGPISKPNGATVNLQTYTDASRAVDGSGFLEANTTQSSGSIGQDVPVVPVAGQSYTLSMWMRAAPGNSAPVSARLTLWGMGATLENGQTTVELDNNWRLVTATLDAKNTGHSAMRAEVYMLTPSRNYNFDSASLQVGNARTGKLTAGDLFHGRSPVRLLDSRPPPEQVGLFGSPWGAGTSRDVVVAGTGVVPAGASAVVLNVTVTGGTAASFLTVWQKGSVKPTASSLNWATGDTVANQVTVKVGGEGKVSVFNNSGTANVIFDVVGYFDRSGTGEGFSSLSPVRLLDSRPPPEQVGSFGSPWGSGVSRDVTVTGSGVPVDAQSVVLNVTVTGGTAPSFLTVWPKGSAKPTASSLNWPAGQTVPNQVTVKVGSGGMVSMFNNAGNVNVIVDVVGFYKPGVGAAFYPLDPSRIQDSRPAPEQVGPYSTPWTVGLIRSVQATSVGAVPAGAVAVLFSATVTATSAASFLTIWPTGTAKPTASSLNWRAGSTVANAVTAKVGAGGAINVFNNAGTTHLIVDVAGYYK